MASAPGLIAIGGFAEVVAEKDAEAVPTLVRMAAGIKDVRVSDGEARSLVSERAKKASFHVHAPAIEPGEEVRKGAAFRRRFEFETSQPVRGGERHPDFFTGKE